MTHKYLNQFKIKPGFAHLKFTILFQFYTDVTLYLLSIIKTYFM